MGCTGVVVFGGGGKGGGGGGCGGGESDGGVVGDGTKGRCGERGGGGSHVSVAAVVAVPSGLRGGHVCGVIIAVVGDVVVGDVSDVVVVVDVHVGRGQHAVMEGRSFGAEDEA